MRSIKAKLKKPTSVVSANKDEWSKFDQRIWHSVAINQPVKLAAKLGKHDNINVNKLSPDVGYSVVHYAAAKGLDDCLNVLLAHKANVSTRDITGATPLHASARYGHKGTTSKLLASRTVDVNARDNNCCTALHFAAFEGHLECLKLIADEKGADIHCVDKEGRTSLMVAAAMGRLLVCTELIKRGVDVDHKDSSDLQHTALTLAAEAGHADVVRLLCENNANYSLKLSDGRNALDVARGRSRKSVIDALHIMQLTEAAKKTDRNSRLSVSSILEEKPEKKVTKSRPSQDSFVPFMEETTVGGPTINTATTTATNQSNPPSKQHDTHKAPPNTKVEPQHNNSTTLSIYNDSKNFSALYDQDVNMYDSKSTLASFSSVDVTNESVRSFAGESTVSPPQQSLADMQAKRRISKLLDDLTQKDALLVSLQNEVRNLRVVAAENESLRAANKKAEVSVKELKHDNHSLATKCQQSADAYDVLTTRIQKIGSDFDKSSQAELHLRKELKNNEKNLEEICSQNSQLIEQIEENQLKYESEQEKISKLNKSIKQALLEVEAPSDSQDFKKNIKLLTSLLLDAFKEKQVKVQKASADQERQKSQLDVLQSKLQEQESEISVLRSRVATSETSLSKAQDENGKLVSTLRSENELLSISESLNEERLATINQLNQDVKNLTMKLSGNVESATIITELEGKVTRLSQGCLRWETKYKEQVADSAQKEAAMRDRLSDVTSKCDTCRKDNAELEKALLELRSERNQREAKVSELEREVRKREERCNEGRVDGNRARQQLTESRRECVALKEEASSLRKSNTDLSSKLKAFVKSYESNEGERRKVDSMRRQLDKLCNHIKESEAEYNRTLAIYRSHLLKAAKGELNPEVMIGLQEILKLMEERRSTTAA